MGRLVLVGALPHTPGIRERPGREIQDAYIHYRHSNIWGHQFDGVAVEGVYPETKLVITFLDPESGRRHSHLYGAWGEDGLAEREGEEEGPLEASDLVTMWLDEPLSPGSPFYGEWRDD